MLKLLVLLTLWLLPVPHPKPIDPQPIFVAAPNVQVNLPPPKKDGWDKLIGVCNLVLASVGIGTLFALRSQLNAVRRTERAILIPVWEQEVWMNPDRKPGDLGHAFQWKYKNEGKTAGFLRETYARMLVLNSIKDLPDAPVYPKEKVVIFKGDPITSGNTMERNFYVVLEDPRDYETISNEYRKGGKVLFVYGMARYTDMFGKMHETRFGLRYAPDSYSTVTGEFVADGPKAYNRYTL